MNIIKYELLPQDELLARIKQTRLRGHDRPYIYRDSTLEFKRSVDPSTLIPAQRYVLHEDFLRIEELYHAFRERNVDIFDLQGGLLFWLEDPESGETDGPIPLIPPIVEESHEPDGRTVALINDGMHRVYAAKRLGKNLNVIYIRNVPEQYPYYAYALSRGWDEVEELETLPDDYVKKTYRDPENYKALFRDFNEVLPGVQKQRKRSNPAHLKQ